MGENYSGRPHGTSNISNQMLQYAPPHPTNMCNAGYSTPQQPGTYRDLYAPPMSHEINKEIKIKGNYASQDNHKYYDQDSKQQTIISTQAGMPIVTEELGQRKEEAIKDNGFKAMQSKEPRQIENTKQDPTTAQEQVKDVFKGEVSEHVFLDRNASVYENEINKRENIKPQQHKLD